MDKQSIIFIKALASGILIALAGSVYLSVDNKYLGALLFSFALLVICSQELNLYTGKIGYLLTEDRNYWKKIIVILIGNIIGIILISLLVYYSNLPIVFSNAEILVLDKLSHKWYEVLALSIPCGILMYIAVEGFRKTNDQVVKIIVLIMAVMIFIIVGFEHSIANIFYITISKMWTLKSLSYEIIMIIGNGIGAIIINYINKLISNNNLLIE